MSFLKFWGRKDKNSDGSQRSGTPPVDPELERRRFQHSLSISRSGRFKQKKRDRGQILDKPELFDGQDADKNDQNINKSQTTNTTTTNTTKGSSSSFVTPTSHNSSPRTHCRDVNRSMASRNMRIGHSVVT